MSTIPTTPVYVSDVYSLKRHAIDPLVYKQVRKSILGILTSTPIGVKLSNLQQLIHVNREKVEDRILAFVICSLKAQGEITVDATFIVRKAKRS